MGADDVGDNALVAGNGFVGTDGAATAVGIVLLVNEIAVAVAVEIGSADRDHVGRGSGSEGIVQSVVAAGCEVNDAGSSEIFVVVELLGKLRNSPAVADHATAIVMNQFAGDGLRLPGGIGCALWRRAQHGLDEEKFGVGSHGMGPFDIESLFNFPILIDRRLGATGVNHGEVGGGDAELIVKGFQIRGCSGVIASVNDGDRANATGWDVGAGGDGTAARARD